MTRWAGVPVDDREVPALAADLVAMVDGFATPGPRMWRALRARGRRERWLADLHRRRPLIVGADLDPHTAAVELLNIIRPFVHEVRRFYPFAPFLGGRAVRDLIFDEVEIDRGTLVLLDVYGQNHDPALWPDPYRFDPERFLGREIGAFDLIPQGGGDPRTGHRCPGEQITVAMLGALVQRLARLDHYLPPQDLTIDLGRIPARPASGVRIVLPD